ncbi:SusC/RagA family TonB-linked outer membrane protein [Flavobacterium sp. ABG]|uniref:SusC/RagA family TonB-linked outer membrane protein n=1 Tax=Flavobacterium sp. ABG TaxID=1423322 RepID=UPI00069A564C|nr:SusC/RagA family TonB-linked outer membrane protein [Flavobacterium sp. ABG]
MKNLKTLMIVLMMFSTSLIVAQTIPFKGKVIDELGLPLPSASVLIKGTTTVVNTDLDGNFEVKLQKSSEILEISFLGYVPVNFNTAGKTSAVITLNPDSQKLDEVVITALGIKKEKKRLSYSVQEVEGDLTKGRDANVMKSLSGKVSGLVVASSSEFFTSPKMYLRGKSPLVVVDGVPLGTDTWNISPDDIESINVLKGSNAAALYGSVGGNGAIQITTKRGASNKKGFVVEFNHNSMIQGGYNAVPKTQNAYGPGSYGNYAFVDGKGGGINDADYDQWGPKFDGQLITQYDSPRDANGKLIATPWTARGANNFDNFMEDGLLSTSNLSLSSNFDKGNIRFSLSKTYQEGINPNTKLNIYNFNLSGRYNLSDKTWVDASSNFNFQTSPNNPNVQYGPNSYIYNMLIWGGADYDVRDLRDYWQKGKEGIQQKNFEYTRYNNPYFMAYEWLRGYYKNDYSGQISINHKFNDSFSALIRTNMVVSNLFQNEKFPYSMSTYGREKAEGDYKEQYDYRFKSYSDFMLNYNKTIKDFEVKATVGANINIDKYRNSVASTNYLKIPGLYTLSNTQTPMQPTSYNSHFETNSWYGSMDLSYKSFLFLGATGRFDTDSRLPEQNNTFFYPSVGLSAVISEIIDIPLVDLLKIRTSYAKVGGSLDIYSNLDTYRLRDPFTIGGTTYNAAYVGEILNNAKLEPAFNSSKEIGIETRMFKNRFGFDVTYYQNTNGPQIFDLKYSETTGYQGSKQNGITTQTKGIEVALFVKAVKTTNFNWDFNVNWSTYKEYLKEVYAGIQNNGLIKIGDRVDAFYINDFMRTNDGKLIVGKDGKPLVNSYQTKVGYKAPDWSMGITNNLRYKNVALNFTFDGRYGGKIENYVNQKMWQSGRHVDSNTPERANDVKGIKSYVTDAVVITSGQLITDGQGNVITDTRTFVPNTTKMFYQDYAKSYHGNYAANIIDKTFFKLREVSLTYSLPNSFLKKSFMSAASISLIGRDLFYFSKNKNIDLDQFLDESASPLQTPTVKSYGINLDLKF